MSRSAVDHRSPDGAPSGHRDAELPIDDHLYAELKEQARSFLLRERKGHTLSATDLVHEACLRVSPPAEGAGDASRFKALAARAMRNVLIDSARARARQKRGGGWRRIELLEAESLVATRALDVLELEEVLGELEGMSAWQAEVVVLRVYGGLTLAEIATALQAPLRSIEADWSMARIFLRRRLEAAPQRP